MARGKHEESPAKTSSKKKKLEWHKIISLLTILAGLLIVQECLYLMYLCIINGYSSAAAWLTAAVGVGEAIIVAGCGYYFGLAKSDHKRGGITFESAKAKGFAEDTSSTEDEAPNNDSPPI